MGACPEPGLMRPNALSHMTATSTVRLSRSSTPDLAVGCSGSAPLTVLNRARSRAKSTLALISIVLVAACAEQGPAPSTRPLTNVITGSLIDGATYLMHIPGSWNRTLVLYSHGYTPPGASNPAADVPDKGVGNWLWEHGYATAGSSYVSTGWAVDAALRDQVEVLGVFEQKAGRPARVLALGESLGGLISAGLIQLQPQRFDAALSACAPLAGSVAAWNQLLDVAFAFNTLLMPNHDLRLVHMSRDSGDASLDSAERVLVSPVGDRTMPKSALVAAVANVAGWFDPLSSRPTTFAAQAGDQEQWLRQFLLPFALAYRAELESRLGGNPSWNTGVDYTQLLADSIDADEVRGLYQTAGLNLEQDLAALAAAPRIAADHAAVDNLSRSMIFNGRLAVPVLTLHTIGDGLVPVQHEEAYAAVVASAGKMDFLRQIYVNRGGSLRVHPG